MPEDKATQSPTTAGQAEEAPGEMGQESDAIETGEPTTTEPDLAGFKSVEDLANSYHELRREYTQTTQRLAQIESFLDQQPEEPVQPERRMSKESYWKMLADHPDPEAYFGEMIEQRVQSRLFAVMADQAEARAEATLPDFAEHREVIKQILRTEKLGIRFPDDPYMAIEYAYAKAVARDRQGSAKAAYQAGGKAAMESLKTGQRAATVSGKPSAKTPATPDFQNMPIDQLESYLAKQGRIKLSE